MRTPPINTPPHPSITGTPRWFCWQGHPETGQQLTGLAYSHHPEHLRGSLTQYHIHVTTIHPHSRWHAWRMRTQHTHQAWLRVLQSLEAQLNAKRPLLTSLQHIYQYPPSSYLAGCLHLMIHTLEQGHPLEQACQHLPWAVRQHATPIFNMGKATQNMPLAMAHLIHHTHAAMRMRDAFKKASTYPLITLSMALLMCLGMLWWVVPEYAQVFLHSERALPAGTARLMRMATILHEHWPGCIITLITTLTWGVLRPCNPPGVNTCQTGLWQRLPWLQQLEQTQWQHDWLLGLHQLTSLQQSITESCHILSQTYQHTPRQSALEVLQQSLASGASLSQAMHASQLFDAPILTIIAQGENSNTLNPMLTYLTHQLTQQIAHTLQTWQQWIEPCLLIALAFIISTMLITLYQPLFDLAGTL